MSNALDQHLIDEGIGGYVNIEQLSEIKTFGAEAYNQTNAAITNYNLNWFTEIETADGDILHISFPEELTLVNNNGAMECIGVTGVGQGAVECKVGADGTNEVEVKLNDVNQKTGLFKVQIKNVQNSASLRESSPFGEIRMTTSDYRPTSSFLLLLDDSSSSTLYSIYFILLPPSSSHPIETGITLYEVRTIRTSAPPLSLFFLLKNKNI